MEDIYSKPRHFCGVAGIYSETPRNIPEKLFYTLFALQHRGQEGAGISYLKDGSIKTYKDLGMVPTVLSRYLQIETHSNIGIGHVKYSPTGLNKLENVQPIHAVSNKGDIAIAHNGALSNAEKIRKLVFDKGAILQSTTDTEIILHLLAISEEKEFRKALFDTLNMLQGAFCFTMIKDDSLIAVRDPHGFRPLYVGKKDDLVVFASETCALDILRIFDVREVEPGEIITVDKHGMRSEFFAKVTSRNYCVFELIYFARPDSSVFGKSVHIMRKKMGTALAEEETVEADIVMAVPDSGNSPALGYSEKSGLPLEYGLSRNHYTGRSFILPTKEQRELMVRMKLNPVKDVVKDKRIILIDDSLVRGTTARLIVKVLREAGAKEIHLRLSSPEIKHPCYFGIDIPTTEELISNRMTPEGIAHHIGADSVRFLSIERLKGVVENYEDFCNNCFTGSYSVET
ncbi:MAG: amidophosphoribosyltransferase [Spirochaetaceae bacterium]|nr:amidophosphoribosyltransferase [Spirochaetaceae bacterium]